MYHGESFRTLAPRLEQDGLDLIGKLLEVKHAPNFDEQLQ